MIYLLEALWYAFLLILKVVFWPAVVVLSIALIARIFGAISRAAKKKKKKKKK